MFVWMIFFTLVSFVKNCSKSDSHFDEVVEQLPCVSLPWLYQEHMYVLWMSTNRVVAASHFPQLHRDYYLMWQVQTTHSGLLKVFYNGHSIFWKPQLTLIFVYIVFVLNCSHLPKDDLSSNTKLWLYVNYYIDLS